LEFENGTGFLFQTAEGPRIITAGHVIGPDTKWDSLVDRCIYYRLAQNGGSLLYDCVVDAKVDPTLDFAEVYLDPFDAPTLEIEQALPAADASLAVTSWRSWGQPGSRATAQSARILDLQPEKMVLSGNYERSDSGSPVLDSKGRLVGLMIEASNQPGGTTQGIAIPVTRFSSILTSVIASPVRRTPIPVLANADKGRARVDGTGVITQFGCVFLGKRSASVTRLAPDMPYGQTVLQSLLNSSTRDSLVGRALAAETTVTLRSDCPTIVEGSAYYAAPRAQLTPGDEITPREILALNYLDDVFFWARGFARARTGNSNIK
jgi:hypothetical protein